MPRVVVGLLILLVSAWLRLDGLDLYSTTDEGYWMQRSLRFGAALVRGDLASTYRAGHPGVTVMWTGVTGIGPDRLPPLSADRYIHAEVLERAPGYLDAFSAARRAVAVVAAGLVTLAVLLAWRLLGPGPALAGAMLLVLDPYVIGMTRLLHVDALLAPLMTVSALSGLVYWTGGGRRGYLLLSGVAGGLALLTKAPAGFLAIFFGLVCLVGLVRATRSAGNVVKTARGALLPLLLWGTLAMAVYLLLFPALWLDPIGYGGRLIRFTVQTGLEPHDGNFFLGRPVLDDPGPLYYLVALPLRMSPLVILGLALLILARPPDERTTPTRWLLVYGLAFVGLMTLASKKFDRYMLPALMVFDLLAGVGLWRLAALCASRGRLTPVVLAVAIAATQVILLVRARPYPIAFYNPLAGGPERARQSIMVGWGEGLEQVADFLNAQPDAERLTVATNYNHVLRPRFVGRTIASSQYASPSPGRTLPTPDYVVVYINATQRRQILKQIDRPEILRQPAFVASINGLEYARVYAIPRTEPRPSAMPPPPAEDEPEIQEN